VEVREPGDRAGLPPPDPASPVRRLRAGSIRVGAYSVFYRFAFRLSRRFKHDESWMLWSYAARLRLWAAAQAGDLATLARAHRADAEVYLNLGLLDEAERSYKASLAARERLGNEPAASWRGSVITACPPSSTAGRGAGPRRAILPPPAPSCDPPR
jgi:hypothetical protein